MYVAFWSVWTWNQVGDERQRAEASVRRSAERAAAAFDGFMGQTAVTVETMASEIGGSQPAGSGCQVVLQGGFEASPDGPPIGRYDLVRADGSVVCTTAPAAQPAQPNRDAPEVPWLDAGYQAGSRTDAYRDGSTGRMVWAVARPAGEHRLAAVIELAPASVQLASLFEDGSGTEFMVWDTSTGAVLSRPSGSRWAPDDEAGRIVASAPVPGTSWRLAAGVSRATAYANTWSEARAAGLGLLAAMVALGLTSLLVHRRIVRPLGAITDAARSTVAGGTTALERSGPAELVELAGVLNDLTASRAHIEQLLKEAADEVASSFERLDAVLANSADMVLIVDSGGRVTFASPAVAKVCGPAARPGTAFTSLVHPEDVPAAAALVQPEGSADDVKAELRMGGPNGWTHVEMVARNRTSHPAVRGIVLNGRDVTERRREAAHRAALDEQLHQSQRLESLGALAGGIAHDFKNLLSVIVWSTEVVADNPASAPFRADLDEISAAAARGVDLSQQLLTFCRRDDAALELIEVQAQLSSLAELLRRTLGERIQLDLQVDPDLPPIAVNQSRFDQAVVNLAVNARDAMGGGGHLLVEAYEQVLLPDSGLAGRYVVVAVSDTGAGMTPDVARRAMDPFYTTKGPGQGTGLGLSIVHGIATSAGGTVRITSEPGQGTTVRLFLPVATGLGEESGMPANRQPVPGDGEVVMVVEDHDALRALVERMLQVANYEVVGAANPAAAIELAKDPAQPLDVVLTDVLMPGMSGVELVARLDDLRPGLPVVYMSANPAHVHDAQLAVGTIAAVLEKPFSTGQLLDALQAALSATEATAEP